MARPPQYERDEDLTRDVTAVKVAVKHLLPADRAHLMAWLLLYYEDTGSKFSTPSHRRRRRIVLDGIEYWLARVPKR